MTKKTTAKKTTKETKPKKAPKDTKQSTAKPQSDLKAIIIAVLSTIIVCVGIAFGVLVGTGIIKLGSDKPSQDNTAAIIDNPNEMPQLAGNLVRVGELKFYLPWSFEAADKNSDGAFIYNLVNDEGWAEVLVYVKKSSFTPDEFLKNISENLEVSETKTDSFGTTWTVAKNADNLAYATKLGNVVYAVYYNVKIESAATQQAAKMIPETLYMNKIYQK